MGGPAVGVAVRSRHQAVEVAGRRPVAVGRPSQEAVEVAVGSSYVNVIVRAGRYFVGCSSAWAFCFRCSRLGIREARWVKCPGIIVFLQLATSSYQLHAMIKSEEAPRPCEERGLVSI